MAEFGGRQTAKTNGKWGYDKRMPRVSAEIDADAYNYTMLESLRAWCELVKSIFSRVQQGSRLLS